MERLVLELFYLYVSFAYFSHATKRASEPEASCFGVLFMFYLTSKHPIKVRLHEATSRKQQVERTNRPHRKHVKATCRNSMLKAISRVILAIFATSRKKWNMFNF